MFDRVRLVATRHQAMASNQTDFKMQSANECQLLQQPAISFDLYTLAAAASSLAISFFLLLLTCCRSDKSMPMAMDHDNTVVACPGQRVVHKGNMVVVNDTVDVAGKLSYRFPVSDGPDDPVWDDFFSSVVYGCGSSNHNDPDTKGAERKVANPSLPLQRPCWQRSLKPISDGNPAATPMQSHTHEALTAHSAGRTNETKSRRAHDFDEQYMQEQFAAQPADESDNCLPQPKFSVSFLTDRQPQAAAQFSYESSAADVNLGLGHSRAEVYENVPSLSMSQLNKNQQVDTEGRGDEIYEVMSVYWQE